MSSDIYTNVYLRHMMDFGDDGVFFGVRIDDVMEEDSGVSFLLEDHVNDLIQSCREEANMRFLYSVAHEFARFAELMRAAAETIEDDEATVSDRYDDWPSSGSA